MSVYGPKPKKRTGEETKIAEEESSGDDERSSGESSDNTDPQEGDGAVVYEVKKAPILRTQALEAVLQFEKAWTRYENSLKNRKAQGWRQEPLPLRECIETKVLRTICEYELCLSRDAWKTVSDEELKLHLFGRSSRLTEQEILHRSSLIEEHLTMTVKPDTSVVDAAHCLFEDLMELLGEGEEPLLDSKRQCKLVQRVLVPPRLKGMVASKIEGVPAWKEAKKDVHLLRRLVLQEAAAIDESYQYTQGEKRKRAAREATEKASTKSSKKTAGASVGSKPKQHSGKETTSGDAGKKREASAPVTRSCYNCGKQGHIGKDCPRPRSVGEDLICYGCGQKGHRKRECPAGDKKIKRVSVAERGVPRYNESVKGNNCIVGSSTRLPFEWDNGADVSCFPGKHFDAARESGAFISVENVQSCAQHLSMPNGVKVQVTHKVVADLLLMTKAGPTQLRGVHMHVLEGLDEVLVGKPEWETLGIPLPDEVLLGRQQEPIACCSVRRVVVEDVPEEMQQEEEGDYGDFPALAAPVGFPEDDADSLEAALQRMLERAAAAGAPADFMEAISQRLAAPLRAAFRTALGKDPAARVEVMDVELIPGKADPPPPGMRRYSPAHKQAMAEQTAELLIFGVIRKGTGGSIVSPVTMVVKPHGRGWRMCVDHRGVNRITVAAPWPFPRIEDILHCLSGAECFGSFDLVKGFWQFPLTERASKRLAFQTHDGIYEPLRVPMGARNAASHFQKVMTSIFNEAGLLYQGVLVWLDDVLLYAKTSEELAALWGKVLEVLKKHGIYALPEKSELYVEELIWVGHHISKHGISVDPERIKALLAVPEPETAANLQQMLAAANWVRDKLPRFAEIVEPLQTLLVNSTAHCKKRSKAATAGVRLKGAGWGEAHSAAWCALKDALAHAVRLAHPKDTHSFHLFADASDHHWGATLTQVPPDQDLAKPVMEWDHEPLAFLSGSFRGSQRNWHTVDKEAYAVHESCRRLEHLLQREEGFNIWTDHRNLAYIFCPEGRPYGTSKASCGRLDRWGMALRDFRYTIQHVAGEANCWADLLSRWGCGGPVEGAVRRVRILLPGRSGAVVEDPDVEIGGDQPTGLEWPGEEAISQAQQEQIQLLLMLRDVENEEWDGKLDGATLQCGQDGLWRTKAGAVWVPDIPQADEHAAIMYSDLRTRLLVIAHTGGSGHRGVTPTRKSLCERYWWPSMEEDVKQFVATCLQCVKVAGGTRIPRPLGTGLVATAPNQILHFDYLYIGEGERGMVYILVLKDDYGGLLDLWVSAAATAEVVAEALLSWFGRNGVVPMLVSDQGPHFKCRVIDDLRRAYKVQHHFTTPYASWANGSVERVNREVLAVLRSLISENQMAWEEWPRLVPAVLHALNSTPTRHNGGHSAIEVATGRVPLHALDSTALLRVKRQKTGVEAVKYAPDFSQHLERLQQALATIHKGVDAGRARDLAANKRAAEKNGVRMHAGFDVGDFVLVANVQPNKLQVRWAGPMRVTAVLNDWSFEVEDLVHRRRTVRHGTMIKKYRDQSLQVTTELRMQLAHDDSAWFQVEKILAWRRLPGKQVEAKVRWVSFGEEADSWEPLEQLSADVPVLVREFLEEHVQDANAGPLRPILQRQLRALK